MRANPRLPDADVNLPKAHPLGEAAFLIGGVGLLLVLVVASIAAFTEIVVWLLPYDAEARLLESVREAERRADERSAEEAVDGSGEGGAASGAESDGVESDPRQGRLQGLVDSLASYWPENPYALRVEVMEDETPNAFAVPGGLIFVTEGLLDGAESENEVAFVLAHEIGHFEGRDHLRALGRSALLGLVLAVAGLGDGGFVSHTSQFLGLRYGREQERDADAFGLGLVHAHYGHVAGCSAFFARIRKEMGALGDLPSFVQTHPASQERIEALGDLAGERGYLTEGTLAAPIR